MARIQFVNRDSVLHVLHDAFPDAKIVIRKVVPAYPLDKDYLVIFDQAVDLSEAALAKLEREIIQAAEILVGVSRYDLNFNDLIGRSSFNATTIHNN